MTSFETQLTMSNLCFVTVFFFRKQFKSKKVMKIDAPESISEKRWRTHVPDPPFDEKHVAEVTNYHLVRLVFRPYTHEKRTIGTSVRNDRILLTVPFSSIVHHFFCEPDTCALTQRISQYHRQTKRRTETDNTGEETYIKTQRQSRVGTATRQDIQDKTETETETRGRRQQTNQETRGETRTMVRCGVHCDTCCCDGGWVVLWCWCVVVCCWVLLAVLRGCVLLLVLCGCVSLVGAS